MTDSGDEEMVAFRLAPADRAAIQRLIERGEFRNRSDLFRHAVKNLLKDYPEARAPQLDLSMDGVELPDVAAPASARGRSAGASSRNRGRSR